MCYNTSGSALAVPNSAKSFTASCVNAASPKPIPKSRNGAASISAAAVVSAAAVFAVVSAALRF